MSAIAGPGGAVLAVLALAAVALAAGGVWQLAHGGERRRAVLMIVAAAVFAGNVLIWTL